MNSGPSGLKLVSSLGIFIFLVGSAIFHAEGVHGFIPFLNVESFVIVVGGTFLVVWSAYPLKTVLALENQDMLEYAARTALSMGYFGTLLGVMLMLFVGVDDMYALPRRFALALSAYFYAFLLCHFILRPRARSSHP